MLPIKKKFTKSTAVYFRKMAYFYFNEKENIYNVCIDGETIEKHKNLEKLYKHNIFKAKTSDVIGEYRNYEKELEDFEKETGFSFKRADHSIQKMSFYIWNLYRDQQLRFEETTLEEEKWIEKASRCGLRFKKEGVYENMVKLDINKFYTKILTSFCYSIPIGKPEKRNIEQWQIDKQKSISYGLYNCKIEGENPIFFKNKENIYTHTEIITAKELGLKVKLLSNQYLYYKKKIRCLKLFKKFLYRLLPHSKNSTVKKVMNILWGSFQEKLKTHKEIKKNSEPLVIDLEMDDEPQFTRSIDGLFDNVKTSEGKRIFKYYACRTSPFITAFGRCYLTKLLNKIKEHVVYVHTDGFITKNNNNIIKHFEISNKIGEFKIENTYDKVEITRKHVNKIK